MANRLFFSLFLFVAFSAHALFAADAQSTATASAPALNALLKAKGATSNQSRLILAIDLTHKSGDPEAYVEVFAPSEAPQSAMGVEINKNDTVTLWDDLYLPAGTKRIGTNGSITLPVPANVTSFEAGWNDNQTAFFLAYDFEVVFVEDIAQQKAWFRDQCQLPYILPWSNADAEDLFKVHPPKPAKDRSNLKGSIQFPVPPKKSP